MNETAANQKTKRRIKSFRVSPAFLELLEGECHAWQMTLSERRKLRGSKRAIR